jgi:hypothetical protein
MAASARKKAQPISVTAAACLLRGNMVPFSIIASNMAELSALGIAHGEEERL